MTDDTNPLLKVLLVEDNSLDRASLLRALRHHNQGIYITEASSVSAACLQLTSHQFDVILAEYELHDGNALAILSQINAMPSDRPAVIIIGGYSDDALAEQCILTGAQAYLIKEDIRPGSLLSTIAQAKQHVRQLEDLQIEAAHLRVQAEHDALTGLYNRHVFDETLRVCIAQAERYKRTFALLMIDLDDFKQINDKWGHCTGDALLQAIAGKLCDVTRDSDRVCRIGGDEFAILLPEILNHRQPAILAERLAEVLLDPLHAFETDILVTASIGIAIYPDNGTTADALLHNADKAMYRCKQRAHYPEAGTDFSNIVHILPTRPG
ncbi:MAG TPA: GGDEF domain-containing response regulator [Pseudomonadales bacterium]|nr:GGDEF domain-containing response regulator [Pseudomonadales bacterium]